MGALLSFKWVISHLNAMVCPLLLEIHIEICQER